MKPTNIFWYGFISKIVIYCYFVNNVYAQVCKFSLEYKIFLLVLMFGAFTDVIYTFISLYDYKHNFKK